MTALSFRGLALAATMVLVLASCQKDNINQDQNSEEITEAAASDMVLQAASEDVFDNAAGIDLATAGDDIGMYGEAGIGLFTEQTTRCFTVTVTPRERGVFPKKVVLDFGNGCEVKGRVRKGKIITVYSGPLHRPGSKAVTEFDGYQVDNLQITGRHEIQNTTEPGSNQRRFTRTVTNAKVTEATTGVWRSWSGTTIMRQVEGNGTPFWPLDDVYQFIHTRRGESSKGISWTTETKEPLVKTFTCRWISKGILEITRNGKKGQLNFGDGTCDNEATLTVNGASKVIKLG